MKDSLVLLQIRRSFCLAVCLFLNTAVITRADSPARTWTDNTGKFRIEAKLFERSDSVVKLLKLDGRVVTVPLEALSDIDKKHLMDIAPRKPATAMARSDSTIGGLSQTPGGTAEHAPASATQMLSADFEAPMLPTNGPQIFLNVHQQMRPIKADPVPYQPVFKEFTRTLQTTTAYNRISRPVLIDPAVPRFAVSTHHTKDDRHESYGRIYLVDSEEEVPRRVLDISNTILLLDHHIESDRSLAVVTHQSLSHVADLVLLKNLAAGHPEVVARAHLPGWKKSLGYNWPMVDSAVMLDANRVIVQVSLDLHCWDLSTGRHLFFVDDAETDVEITGTGKYLCVPVSSGFQIIDVDNAKLVGTVPAPRHTKNATARFSPNGEMLAFVYTDGEYFVWDLVGGRMQHHGKVQGYGGLNCWIGNEYMLTSSSGLIDISTGRTLWKYGGALTYAPKFGLSSGVAFVTQDRYLMLNCLPTPHHSENEGLGVGESDVHQGRWRDREPLSKR